MVRGSVLIFWLLNSGFLCRISYVRLRLLKSGKVHGFQQPTCHNCWVVAPNMRPLLQLISLFHPGLTLLETLSRWFPFWRQIHIPDFQIHTVHGPKTGPEDRSMRRREHVLRSPGRSRTRERDEPMICPNHLQKQKRLLRSTLSKALVESTSSSMLW